MLRVKCFVLRLLYVASGVFVVYVMYVVYVVYVVLLLLSYIEWGMDVGISDLRV